MSETGTEWEERFRRILPLMNDRYRAAERQDWYEFDRCTERIDDVKREINRRKQPPAPTTGATGGDQ